MRNPASPDELAESAAVSGRRSSLKSWGRRPQRRCKGKGFAPVLASSLRSCSSGRPLAALPPAFATWQGCRTLCVCIPPLKEAPTYKSVSIRYRYIYMFTYRGIYLRSYQQYCLQKTILLRPKLRLYSLFEGSAFLWHMLLYDMP